MLKNYLEQVNYHSRETPIKKIQIASKIDTESNPHEKSINTAPSSLVVETLQKAVPGRPQGGVPGERGRHQEGAARGCSSA